MLSWSLFGPASVLLAAFLASPATAQLTTSCNPTEKTCPVDAAFGTDYTFYFNSTPDSSLWASEAGTIEYDTENGAIFTIPKKGYSPTLTTQFYFFWGRTEVIMKTANGTGIVSSIVYGSDDLDEVDWEFLGGNTIEAQTNYYGKGVTTVYDHGANFNATGNIQTEWHNYTNVWTEEKLEWWLDGTLVRTLLPADANDTWSYPQTPMSLRLGIWAGGDSSQAAGTIEWAGGETDYSTAPFTMYVKSVRITDYSKGTAYNYTDRSGNSSSIQIVK
jgi:beta-glucanase (GH16 family)